VFNPFSCIPSIRRAQPGPVQQSQPTQQTWTAPRGRLEGQLARDASPPAPTLHLARFRSGPERRQHYYDCIHHAVQHLDTGVLKELLDNPPHVGVLTRLVAINQEVPSTFPGARSGDSLLHVLADRTDDPVKAAHAIVMLQKKQANTNALNDSLETPAMRAAAAFQQPQLMALVQAEAFDSTIRRPVRDGNDVRLETLWNQVERTGNVRARMFLNALPEPTVDRSEPILIRNPDGVREGPPPAYGSNVGVRVDNSRVLPPQAWTSDTPGRAWTLAGAPPVYWSNPPYVASEADSTNQRQGDSLTRRFSNSDAVNEPLVATRFRRSSAA
jgi:hypothetical protein